MFVNTISLRLKIVVFVIIVLLFFYWLIPNYDLFHTLRVGTYKLFQKGVCFTLNYQTRTYETLASTNFILKYTEADEELAPLVLALAEDYLVQIEKILGITPEVQAIPLVLYSDVDTLQNSFGWSGDKSAVGVYWAGTIRLVSPRAWSAYIPENEAVLWETFEKEGPLAHELTHFLVDEATKGNYPRWLSEGLAQYVEEKITGYRLALPIIVDTVRFYPFSALGRDFDQQSDQSLAYWQSLQAVQKLLTEYGMERLTCLLSELGQGKNFTDAFFNNYGQAFADFEETLWEEMTDEILHINEW